MKKSEFYYPGLFLWVSLLIIISVQAQAQQDEQDSDFGVNVDLYSSYVWRGTKLGTGPSVQPSVKFSGGGFTVGVWGAFDASGYAEADPYVAYEFPFGLSLGVTDYYYPGQKLFDISEATGSQAFELNGGFSKGGFSLSANYIVNQAGGAASAGGDKYFQAGYSFSRVNMFVGAGDGWHTSDGKFNVCNIGLGTIREIKLTDSFSIPVTGQVIVNPEREQLFVVAGFSF
ncbi:MAG TPA: TorF family putative porin [Bacteroidales bacterium]|nr:TorF family putative porin [Bacteroidales bacterium]